MRLTAKYFVPICLNYVFFRVSIQLQKCSRIVNSPVSTRGKSQQIIAIAMISACVENITWTAQSYKKLCCWLGAKPLWHFVHSTFMQNFLALTYCKDPRFHKYVVTYSNAGKSELCLLNSDLNLLYDGRLHLGITVWSIPGKTWIIQYKQFVSGANSCFSFYLSVRWKMKNHLFHHVFRCNTVLQPRWIIETFF